MTSPSNQPDPGYRLGHATHNHKIAGHLLSSAVKLQPWDWVVTLSFYSVVHYVESLIESKKCSLKLRNQDLDSKPLPVLYALPQWSGNFRNYHAMRREIVDTNFRSLRADYKDLHDACHNARYNDYKYYEKTLAGQYYEEIDSFRRLAASYLFPKEIPKEFDL